MKKLPVIILVVSLMALMGACGNPYDIVGDWKSVSEGGTMYMQFEKNDSFRVAFIPDDKNDIGFSCRGGWVINNQEVTFNYDLSTFALESKRDINTDNPKNQALLQQKKSEMERQLLLHVVYVITLSDSNNVLQLVNSSQTLNYHRIDSMPQRLQAPIYLDNMLFKGQIGKQEVEMYLTIGEPDPGQNFATLSGRCEYQQKGSKAADFTFEGKYYEDNGGKIVFSTTSRHGTKLSDRFTGTLVKDSDSTYVVSGNLVDNNGGSEAVSVTSSSDKKKKNGDSLLEDLIP